MMGLTDPRFCGMGRMPLGTRLNQLGFGRFAEFFAEQDGNQIIIHWIIHTLYGLAASDLAVFLFDGATFLKTVRADASHTSVDLSPGVRTQTTLVLAPNTGSYASDPFVRLKNLSNKVRLTYELAGDAYAVRIHRNDGTAGGAVDETTPEKSFTKPRVNLADPVGGTSGFTLYVSGKWNSEIDRLATISVAVTTNGGPGVGAYSWTWGIHSGTGTIQNWAQPILNGIRIRFDDETYIVGDVWTIEVGPPLEWTTSSLANGTWKFKVATENQAGFTTMSTETVQVAIETTPNAPTKLDKTYDGVGTGTGLVRWLAPPDAGVDRVRIYRNRPDRGWGDYFPVPEVDRVVAPGAIVSHNVTGLTEGVNRFVARFSNNFETEENEAPWEFNLDASLTEVVVPASPIAVSAKLLSSGFVEVTVWADASSTVLNLYTDDGAGGAIDYGTVVATIANPQAGEKQELKTTTLNHLSLADGSWTVGVRAMNGATEETNTDRFYEFTVDTVTASEAQNLLAVLV